MKKMLILFFCVFPFSNSIAQNIWQELLPPVVNPFSIAVSSAGNQFVEFETNLIRSTDNGQSWELVFPLANRCAFSTSPTGVLYLIDVPLRKSTDEGNTWTTLSMPIPASYCVFEPNPIVTNNNGDVFIQMENYPSRDLYRSTDEGQTWIEVGIDSCKMIDMIFKENICLALFVKPNVGMYLYKSTDNGNSWEMMPPVPSDLYSLLWAKNGTIYGGAYQCGSGCLFVSSDSGMTWQEICGFNPDGIFDIVENQLGHIFLATGYGVYRSTDDGDSWNHYNAGLFHIPTHKLAVDSLGYMFATTGVPEMFYGTINITIPVEILSFSAKQNDNRVHLNWETATELNNLGFEIERRMDNSEWRIIGFKEGKGTTTDRQYYSFVDENISNGKYHYRLKQLDYDGTFEYSNTIELEILNINNFSLEQNYPNPFNPLTTIKYKIPENSFVTIKVYDVLGNEVTTLVNVEKSADSYEVEIDGTGFPSGIYFYKLQAGSFVETKKMVIIK
ncbi:MAG: T9SS type A sorting domain-containing protein [Ignavibacteria bacterium]|nr:T9SS type A sorting domain-containing protein [Ignavibacteria bacterium]MBT8381541.1 T9SS type A sorting domain-containing protein [Ignavibacteria bacterium]MBT8392124.1 T9SS type A sorting domain-containing protein [Ignavibacteria bacterium]NNL21320.1 T9SS type A sorting domain-containing protein [Ignavibacteriaceae bacterium]